MREFWLDCEDVRLYGVEEGDGPTIVMLHGGMGDHRAVLPLVAPLTSSYRVVAPDLRGSGRSWWGSPLTFDRLTDDVAALLDHLGVDRAVVGGASQGTGVALRFALRHPNRLAGLVMVQPIYAGEEHGYTEQQKDILEKTDAVASRTLDEGIQALRPMYANLPPAIREKALAMIEEFDPASVVTTSRFVASGAQPFRSAQDLESLSVPTLLVRGEDPLHPAEVSDLYAAHIPNCTVAPASTTDVAGAIGEHCQRIFGSR